MRILITGSNGQLGHDLMEQARSRDWQAVGADLPQCDITNGDSVAAALAAAGSPAAVINAAAYTAVDAAEGDPATAYAVNRDGVATLASICREHQVPLIHVSTDYVFDGLKTSPYRPTDPIRPSGVYGHRSHSDPSDHYESLHQCLSCHAGDRWRAGGESCKSYYCK